MPPVCLAFAIFLIYLRASSAVVITDTGMTVALDQHQLLAALNDPNVTTIALVMDLTLTPQVFSSGAVQLQRRVTIMAQYPSNFVTVDVGGIDRGAIICIVTECVLTIQGPGLLFTNNFASAFDFAPFLPSLISASLNGTLLLRDYDIVTAQVTIWVPTSIIYTAPGWVGDLAFSCESSSSLLVQQWNSTQRSRDLFLQPTRPSYSTGSIQTRNVRMLLGPSYVCNSSSWTASACLAVVKVCNSSKAESAPLPESACSPEGLLAACKPPPPPRPPPPLPPSPSPSPLALSAANSASQPRLWWIGVLVGGLAVVVVLTAGGLALARWRAAKLKLPDAALSSKQALVDRSMAAPPGSDNSNGASKEGGVGQMSTYRLLLSETHVGLPGCEGGAQPGAVPGWAYQPPTTAARQPQLAGNPLDLEIGQMLGFGAFGSVYVAQWRGQQVAVKVMRHSVADQDELDSLLQLREATLGAELVHERIVRTLAYALLVPEDACDDNNKLLKAAIVEVHIVSQLCDRGTLKEWLQVVHRVTKLRAATQGQLGHSPHYPASTPQAATSTTPSHLDTVTGGDASAASSLGLVAAAAEKLAAALPDGAAAPCPPWSGPALLDGPPLPPSNLAPVRTPSPTPAPGPPTSGAWQSLTGSGPPHPGSRHHHHSLTALTSVPLPPLAGAGEDTSAPQALASSRSHVLLTTKSGQASQAGVLALPSPLPRSGDAANPLASHPTAGQPGKLLAAQLTALGAASARLKQPGDRAPASASSEAAESHGGVSTDGSCLYPPLACLAAADSLLGAGLHSHFHWHLLAVVDIARQIAEGLEYLQSRGVVHGDLKLQNCLACSDPSSPLGFSVKICDFGLSRILQGNKTHTTVTQPPGTLAYLAPELLTTCYMSPSCDLYGLGILLWELLVMRQPFSNLTVAQILFAKATGTIDEYLPFPALAPHSYVLLAKQCWSTAPSARPSLREVMQRLQAVSAETGLQHCARCSSQPRYPALPP